MATCKGCGATILWLQTQNNKNIPVDPLPVGYREREKAKGKVVTQDGRIVSCDLTNEPGAPTGYVPHWATCPKAADFHRRKK